MSLQLDLTLTTVRRFVTVLILIETLFVVFFLSDVWILEPIGQGHHLISLDGETTIPAWFSSVQLSLIGVLLLISSRNKSTEGPSSWFLFFLGLGFIFLSADEATYIHETLTTALRKVSFWPRFSGNQGLWIPLYSALGLVFLLAVRRQLFGVWKYYRKAAGVGFSGVVILLAGGVALEVIGYEFLSIAENKFLYDLEVALEEFLEMCGASIILYGVALFEYSRREKKEQELRQHKSEELEVLLFTGQEAKKKDLFYGRESTEKP